MNARVERHLEAESSSDSRGYIVDRPVRYEVTANLLDGTPDGTEPARWSTSEADVAVPPLAGLAELLRIASPEER